jgi:hypothetical protein
MSIEQYLEGEEEGLYITEVTHIFRVYQHPDDPPCIARRIEQLPLGERLETRRYATITGERVWEGPANQDVPGTLTHPDRQDAYYFLTTVRYSGDPNYFREYRVERSSAGKREWEARAPSREYTSLLRSFASTQETTAQIRRIDWDTVNFLNDEELREWMRPSPPDSEAEDLGSDLDEHFDEVEQDEDSNSGGGQGPQPGCYLRRE